MRRYNEMRLVNVWYLFEHRKNGLETRKNGFDIKKVILNVILMFGKNCLHHDEDGK